MDDKRLEGAGHQVKGAVKEGIGKMTDDHSQEAEGKLEKHAGKAERKVGELQDDVRDALD
ncbi:MAG TPA: CsbD family protein [Xanthomonadaceae bacterium]|jgi:uncharacterized protein YjbJ (UPF0337 family)|nr:CsbD family protein [Xanthomonadaceae bacterium]